MFALYTFFYFSDYLEFHASKFTFVEGITATHDLFSDQSMMDNGNDTVLFDWER